MPMKFGGGLSISVLRNKQLLKKKGRQKFTFWRGMLQQKHPDRTNLRILKFVDNKNLHGLSESLTSVPVIDGTQLEMKTKPILPTHSSNNVCLCALDFKPRFGYMLIFFARPITLLLLPLVITFLPPLSFSLLYDIKRTNERANERTDGNSPLLTSCSSFAYLY
jgi:hypothetical protein